MKNIRAGAIRKSAPKLAAINKLKQEVDNSLSEKKTNYKEAEKTLNEISLIEIDVEEIMVDAYGKAFALLTDAQKDKLKQIKINSKKDKTTK